MMIIIIITTTIIMVNYTFKSKQDIFLPPLDFAAMNL